MTEWLPQGRSRGYEKTKCLSLFKVKWEILYSSPAAPQMLLFNFVSCIALLGRMKSWWPGQTNAEVQGVKRSCSRAWFFQIKCKLQSQKSRLESLNIKSINPVQATSLHDFVWETNKNPVVWHNHCILCFNDVFQNLSKLLMEKIEVRILIKLSQFKKL